MTLRYEFDRDVATVFQLLTDPDFLVQRSSDLGELSAQCEVEEEADATRIVQSREIERDLPSFLSRLFDPRQKITVVEEWKRQASGYRGSFTYEVIGQPVTIKGRFELKPRGEGCEYSVSHDVKVKIPLIGGRAEKFVASQARESVLKELEYAAGKLS